MLSPGADEQQEQQRGENAVVLKAVEEGEHHQEEPRHSTEPVIRIPRRRSSRRHRRTTLQFTLWQVEEMEKMFKETQYPHVLARKELAQALNIPEVKVKTWFVHRRAEERKSERSVGLQSIPPRTENLFILRDRDSYP
ncbi:homeobox protein Rhox13-like isoform X2 [Peromyscus maniculatus bairdii]|uniref:homeobox protein Rhox13-like isoform X2 n=1 Tax=Peromyscus maniculatus bairdii TaxID=230844 RepID=UPI003FD2E949